MNSRLSRKAGLIAGLLLLLAVGCTREIAPPTPIAIDQAPASLKQAFNGSSSAVKTLADDAVGALEKKDYTKALFALQTLAARSDLTSEQRDLAARSTLAVNQALADQAANGDQQAQQVLQFQRSNK